jgi:hypothetical protein
MHNCELDSAVTLRDVFDFIEMHVESIEPILGNWVRDFLEESKQPYEEKEGRDLERLELYWFLESDHEFGTSGMAFPSLHGVGASGEKYGVDFSACNGLMNLPLSLKADAEIFMRDSSPRGKSHSTIVLPKIDYTLLGILYGIIWELSFFGPPKKRDEEVKKLMAVVEDAKLHPEKLVTLNLDDLQKRENPKKDGEGLDTAECDEV